MKNILLLLKKAKWLVGGNFVFAFSQWVILILLARLTTKENLGQYSLALAIVTPFFAVSNLQLRPLYILDKNSSQLYVYANFFYLRIISSIIAFIFCLFFGLTSNVIFLVLFLVGLLKFFESLSDIIYAYYNAHEMTELISKSLMIKGIFSVFAIFSSLYFFDFYIALSVFVFVYFIVWLFLDNLYIIKTKEIKNLNLNLNILKSAIPMGVTLGIISLQSAIPKFFLDKYLGVEAVGVFTVLSYFIIVGSIFINSICQFLSPRLTNAWHQDREYFKKLLYVTLLIAGILGVGAILLSSLLGAFLLDLIYGPSYIIYENELVLLMLAGFILYLATVLGYALTSIGVIKQQIYLFSILLGITFISSYLYIPSNGLAGGIYTLIISYIFQCILAFLVIFMRLKGK